MKTISNIIFVSEQGSDEASALALAFELARSNQAKITIISCINNLKKTILEQAYAEDLLESVLAHKQSELVKFINANSPPNEIFEAKVFLDKPLQDIITEVVNGKADLLIKPAEQNLGLKQRIFGSLDNKLMRLCPCPVWLIKSAEQNKERKILVALDYTPEDPQLNLKLLDFATSLALSQFSALHIIHAWELENESFLRSPRTKLSDVDVDKMLEVEHDKRQSWLSNIVEQSMSSRAPETIEYLSPELHIEKGPSSEVITQTADKLNIELLVIATIGRSGIPGYLIGNTAESVLADIDCSVLTLKPEGFTCPLELK